MFKLRSGSVIRRRYLPVLKDVKTKAFSSNGNLPKQADVVIIGGGVSGCSTLYHLSKRGIKAVLLEKGKLGGSTWHTGGFIWSLRYNDVDIQLLKSTRELQTTLQKEVGGDTGFVNSGGLFIARTDDRLEEYKRIHSLAHFFQVENHMLPPSEVSKLAPGINTNIIKGALYSPNDGYTDPNTYCSALVKAATSKGGQVIENCSVTKIITDNAEKPKIKGIETDAGTIKTSCVVNAAGIWAPSATGVNLPISPMKHSYSLTGSISESKNMPAIRDADGGLYLRPQGDSILFGGFEVNPEIIKEIPENFQYSQLQIDKSKFDYQWKNACQLFPSFEKAGVKEDIRGPEAFTPDHKPIMGEDPYLLGLFYACGFNALGVQLSGGCAEQLATWIIKGRPDLPMFSYDIRRFTPLQRSNKAWVTETSQESYAKTYNIAYKHRQALAGRNHKIDQFHEALVASGAVMEQVQGWERPGYFVKDRTAPVRGYDWYGQYDHIENTDKRYQQELEGDQTFDFSKHHDLIREEALAARNNVVVFDTSSFTKMYLTGKDAQEAADWLFTADLDKEPGKVIYTCTLNSKGGVEADITVVPLEEGGGTLVGPILKGKGYYIVAGGGSGHQTKCHLLREIARKNFKAVISVTTDKMGVLSIQGPKSGELLQSMTETPITDEKFPTGMSRIIKINGHTCRAMRISYIGELGYELHIPVASCVPVYNRLMDAGRGFDLKHAGFRALESLNCEKGYHLTNRDLRLDDSPVEANLLRVCRKEGQYLGKPHVEKLKEEGVKKRRVFFTVKDKVALNGFETIWRDDTVVGFLRRGEYGYSLDCSVGIGYVEHPKGSVIDNEFLKSGNYQIEVGDKKYPATLHMKSPFDPKNQRRLGIYENQFQEQTHFED